QHVAGRRRLLSLGRSRIRAVLGLSEWLAHVGVFAGRHGDLPGAVQSIFAVLHSWTGFASGMAYLACDYMGRSVDQHSRLNKRESHFNHRRMFCDARFSRVVDRKWAADYSYSVATFRV